MKKEMEHFEVAFKRVLSSDLVTMDGILDYIASSKGKRLRPTLVFLTARLFGEINASTRRTALFVEMLHTATLIHDDVVDGSEQRRGRPSVNAQWDNKTAVLAGDYLLSKALLLLTDSEDHLVLKEMLDVAMKMSEGEMMQSGKWKMENGERRTENLIKDYLDVIERKTALLIQACCLAGAQSVLPANSPLLTSYSSPIGDFGLNLGLVFQMRDDILDNDDPESVAIAKEQLPIHLEKALKALDAMAPMVKDQEAWAQLRELTVFCAERNH